MVYIIEAGLSEEYYAPQLAEQFTTFKWEAKTYTSIANAKRAIYALQYNPNVKVYKKQKIKLRVRPIKPYLHQYELFT